MAMILLSEALAEKEVGGDVRAELADVAGAEQKLVTGHFGVCRGLAKGRDEELGPTMHRDECVLSRPPTADAATNDNSVYSKCSGESDTGVSFTAQSSDGRDSLANRKQSIVGSFSDRYRVANFPIWFYDFTGIHGSVQTTSAMVAGIADHIWPLKV